MVIDDDMLMLQDEPALPLAVISTGWNLSDFCDELSSQASQALVVTYAISCRANKRLVRVLRTENNVSTVVHFVLLDRLRVDGSRALSLQPVVAWTQDVGKQVTVPMRRADATRTIIRMKSDLAKFGADAATAI